MTAPERGLSLISLGAGGRDMVVYSFSLEVEFAIVVVIRWVLYVSVGEGGMMTPLTSYSGKRSSIEVLWVKNVVYIILNSMYYFGI